MIIAGLVAAVVAVVGFLAQGLPLRRSKPGRSSDVAVLLVVRDEAGLDAALAAARTLTPSVFVVSGAPLRGVDAVTTMRPLADGAAAAVGMREFRLVSRFRFVLVLDVDTRMSPDHLAHALPLFKDPSVTAVDARVTATAVLGGYWARTGPAGIGRVHRTSALADWDGDDLDLAVGTQRVVRSPGPPAVAAAPGGSRRAHVEWYRGAVADAWAAVRRSPRHGFVRWLDLVLGAVVLMAVLVAAVLGGVMPALAVLAGFVVGDVVVTALVTPRQVLAAPVIALVRLIDAGVLLRSWVLVVAVGVAAVARVAALATTLPAAGVERVLTDLGYRRFAGFGTSGPDRTLTVTDAQFDIFAALTGPFQRHTDLLTGTRELSVVAVAVLVCGLVVIAVSLRVRPVFVLVAVAVVLAAAPVLTQLGPGLVAAAWLAVGLGAILFVARRFLTRRYVILAAVGSVGVVAILIALATLPILIVPLAVGVATWLWFLDVERYDTDATWRGPAGVVLYLTGCVVALLWHFDLLVAPAGTASVEAPDRTVALVVVAVLAAAGFAVPRAWPVATGTLAGVGLVAWLGAGAAPLLPVLVASAAVSVMLVLAAIRPALLATGLTVALAAALAATVLIAPPAPAKADHEALADWVTRELPGDVRVAVPTEAWAELHRDFARRGQPDAVVTDATGLYLVTTGPRSGVVLARFGTLMVLATDLDVTYLDPGRRTAAGRQLADNPRLRADDDVTTALRTGRVDLRAMAVLAAFCAEHDVTLATTGNPASERGTPLPHRTITLSDVDGQRLTTGTAGPLLEWLDAQLPPYAPAATRVTPDGVAISWRLPTPLDGATR